MIYIETGSRAYPLRFTARSLLRAISRGQTDVPALLRGGAHQTALLLYAALCSSLPHLTLRQAQSLLETHLDSEKKLNSLLTKLTHAYDESGFPPDGITKESFERLLDAASRAGFMHVHTLYDLTYTEIVRELNAFLAQKRLHSALPGTDSPMTDDQMRSVLHAIARRDAFVNA